MAHDWGWKRIRSETKVLNAREARQFALEHHNLQHAPTERVFEENRLKKLKEVLVSGRSISYNWATVVFGGQLHRMNGQHSSLAILECDGQLPEEIVFHIDQYEAAHKEGMANLFQQFDARWGARSTLDVSGAHQGLNERIKDCDRHTANLAISGVSWSCQNVLRAPAPSGDSIGQLFWEDELTPYILWVNDLFSEKTNEMKQKGVVAAMYGTYIINEPETRNFWLKVAAGKLAADADDTESTIMLSTLLRDEVDPKKKRRMGRDEKPMGIDDMYGSAVLAWNAFRKGVKPRTLEFEYDKKKGFPTIAR